jgi:hypothetical protein
MLHREHGKKEKDSLDFKRPEENHLTDAQPPLRSQRGSGMDLALLASKLRTIALWDIIESM